VLRALRGPCAAWSAYAVLRGVHGVRRVCVASGALPRVLRKYGVLYDVVFELSCIMLYFII
jgi:hypothetical protein